MARHYSQALFVLFSKCPTLGEIRTALESDEQKVVSEIKTPESLAQMCGPCLIIEWESVKGGQCVIDVTDTPWPDDMGDSEKTSNVYETWQKGGYGPCTLPGSLAAAAGRAMSANAKQAAFSSTAFVRLRVNFECSRPDGCTRFRELAWLVSRAWIITRMRGALAFFNPNSQLLLDPDSLERTVRDSYERGVPPVQAMIGVSEFDIDTDNYGGVTMGVEQFGCPEQEVIVSRKHFNSECVSQFLLNTALYIVKTWATEKMVTPGDTTTLFGLRWRVDVKNQTTNPLKRMIYQWKLHEQPLLTGIFNDVIGGEQKIEYGKSPKQEQDMEVAIFPRDQIVKQPRYTAPSEISQSKSHSETAPTPLPAQDFADWLSPILVKELRQGLKTRVFVGTFILVQVVMIVLMGLQLISLANGAGSGVSSAFEAFFWSFIWIAVLMLMPARGLTAISEETKANTLDLVQLTRLSAFRIVLGKWVALTTQTVMIIASILPYAVLRYFFGSVDIVEDLKNIAIILSVSLVLTAGTIALSTAHLAVRIIMIVGAFMTYVLLGTFMAARTFGVMSGGASIEYLGVWWFHLLTFPIYVYVLLEVAASKIATASENHSARKRTLALVLAVVLPASAAMKWEDFGEAWFVCFAPVWIWIVIEALCEKSSDVPSLYVPIVRRGALGKLGGRLFLYPGWASGMFFTFLLILCGVGAFELANLHSSNALKAEQLLAARILFVVFTASIISPLIMLLFMPRARQRMWFYILFQLLMALIYLICSIAADLPSGERSMAYRWLAPFPTSVIFASLQKSEDLPLMKFYLTTAVPVAVLLVLYLVFRAIREFGRIKAYEDEAALEANKAPIARR